jgi:hypothetical protein
MSSDDFLRLALHNLLRALKRGSAYPNAVALDEYLSTWFSCLWRLSLIAPMREHGAALVEAGGLLTVAAARPGSMWEFQPEEHEKQLPGFLGYFHTHPSESGMAGLAFGPADLRLMIDSFQLCLVQSGDYVFMVARTRDTPARVALDELSNIDFKWRVESYLDEGSSWQRAILETNLDLCHEYGLAFYGGKLRQPLVRLEGGR